MTGWTTALVAGQYRKLGSKNPLQAACGTGRQKYGAQKTTVDGIVFASKAEARAYQTLRVLEVAGKIFGLTRQPRFLLQEKFTDGSGRNHRAIYYQADFMFQRDLKDVVIEVKGYETEAWKLKEKLFRSRYPNTTLEVWK